MRSRQFVSILLSYRSLKKNIIFQTFVLATAVAGTTVSAAATAAGSQIGKFEFHLKYDCTEDIIVSNAQACR